MAIVTKNFTTSKFKLIIERGKKYSLVCNKYRECETYVVHIQEFLVLEKFEGFWKSLNEKSPQYHEIALLKPHNQFIINEEWHCVTLFKILILIDLSYVIELLPCSKLLLLRIVSEASV